MSGATVFATFPLDAIGYADAMRYIHEYAEWHDNAKMLDVIQFNGEYACVRWER